MWVWWILSALLFGLAAFCNSIMDIIAHKFKASILDFIHNKKLRKWLESDWRDKYIDGDPKKGRKKIWGMIIPVAILDGWHFTKFLMIVLLIMSILTAQSSITAVWQFWVLFFVYGIVWNVVFNFSYGKFLLKKTYQKEEKLVESE
jgi:MFS family permease